MKGWKTWVGTLGYAVLQGIQGMYPQYEAICVVLQQTIFIPLGVVGIAHKIEKSKG